MGMLLHLENVGLTFKDRRVFEKVTLTVNKGDRIGLVGPNGAGKTTLLGCICGDLIPDEGDVTVTRGVTLGYLRQNSGLDHACTVLEEMESVFTHVRELERQMHLIEEQMTVLTGAGYEDAARRYADVHDKFVAVDGFSVPVKIRTVLTGMGFSGRDEDIVANLSGGEKTRLALAKLLLESPDVLILDEPTNHLDFKTILWLEDYLADFPGALLTVSHDRYFLDKGCGRIWELEDGHVSTYRGNYSAYKIQKAERVKTALREYEKETARIVSMQEYAQRNIVRASTSNMAKSRLHQLEHIDLPVKPRTSSPTPRFTFETEMVPVKDVLDIREMKLTVGQPPLTLAERIDLHVLRGERIAILGANGTGKTTLIRRLVRSRKTDDPCITWGRNTSVSVFEQEDDHFLSSNTVMDELWRHRPSAQPQQIRDRLGHMLFSGEDVFKTVSVLSGGEKARLKFAILAEEKSNVLLLDEPTNHLDLPAREALETAAANYDGTLLFVSHDRYFINRLATKVLELKNGEARLYDGNFDDYLAVIRKEEEALKNISSIGNKKEGEGAAIFHRSKQQRAEDAKRKKRIAQLEQLIADGETTVEECNRQLADPAIAADYEKVSALCETIESTRKQCDAWTEEWMELSE